MSERNYREDVKIDFLNMHENWKDQADNFLYWSEKWVNEIQKKDKRRQHLNIIIRDNPGEFNLKSSPSETAIRATIECDEEYIELHTNINTYSIIREAFNHRRSALESLTKLYLNGYFQGPPEEVKHIQDEIKKERGEKVAEKQREGLKESGKRIKKKSK
jgi:hypothetical protein